MFGASSITRQHVLTAIVAVAVLGVSFSEGAYAPGVFAAMALIVWVAVLVLALGKPGWVALPPAAIACGVALAGVSVLAALSVAWGEDDGRAVAEAVRAAFYAGLLALVFFGLRDGPRPWLNGLAIGLALLAVAALAVRLEPSLPGGDDEIASILPAAMGRISYPIGYWNALAAAMALGLVLLSWVAAAASTRAGRTLGVAAMPACVLVVYLASSRGALAAALVGVAVLVAAVPDRQRLLGGVAIGAVGGGLLALLASRRHELVDGVASDLAERQGHELLAAAVLVCAAAAAARWALDGHLDRFELPRVSRRAIAGIGAVVLLVGAIAVNLPERLDEFNDPPAQGAEAQVAGDITRGGGSGRYQFWSAALDAFQEDPMIGVGAGGYEYWWNQHGSLVGSVRDAHSIVFELPAELGLGGLVLLLVFLGAAGTSGITRFREAEGAADRSVIGAALAMFATGVAASAIDWIWEFPAVFGVVVVAAALLTGPTSAPSQQESWRNPWCLATLAFGSVAIVFSLLLALSEIKLEASRGAADDSDLTAAAQDARDAATLQPWAAEPRLQLALVEELGGDLDGARGALADAIERAPEDWRLQLVTVRLYTREGRLGIAQDALERARELNPRSPVLQAPAPPPAAAAGSP